ncbi:hypothetical protein HY642_05600 [Candidatus Woesearchaeota archaeon]|nr:hypothetical protein [Candidatus Woesearchaeota archaeon]
MEQSWRRTAIPCIIVAVLLFVAACAAPQPEKPTPTAPPIATPTAQPVEQSPPVSTPSQPPEPPSCATKDCFVPLANDCKDADITVTEDAGVFRFLSKDCVFTKTLVTPNSQETSEMKALLQGKSLACKYDKGRFDQRWTESLVFGIENCEGELKDILVQLLAFTS